eukprot:s386_g35.t2
MRRALAAWCACTAFASSDRTDRQKGRLYRRLLSFFHYCVPKGAPRDLQQCDHGTTFVWAGDRRAAGGTYRLCWAANGFPQALTSDFEVDIGAIKVLGPGSFQNDRTCISGQLCVWSGINGVGLQDGDRVVILDKCAKKEGRCLRTIAAQTRAASTTGEVQTLQPMSPQRAVPIKSAGHRKSLPSKEMCKMGTSVWTDSTLPRADMRRPGLPMVWLARAFPLGW